MKKRHFVLVLGLLAVMMISNLEDYISSPQFSIGEQEYETIDYYLTDFSLSAIQADGKVSHTVDGQYLAYWQSKEASFIIQPRLVSKDNSGNTQARGRQIDGVVLTAEEALIDHKTEEAELSGAVKLRVSNNETTQLSLDTSQLKYRIGDKHISTEEDVSIISPHIQLTGTGLDSNLNETTLRLNANVKSTYRPN
ncbi:MAG: LPS export ABC transporter periplasmic protein LptC [Thiolinea sp.]